MKIVFPRSADHDLKTLLMRRMVGAA